jgi:hypothetical protein
MTTPGKLTVGADGKVTGPVAITHNSPWPCVNGQYEASGDAMSGTVMHTMVGNLPGTVGWFNNKAAQVSAHFGIAQDGSVWQFGPIGQGWCAWAEMQGNSGWYSIEHADDGNTQNPLTPEQIVSSAQILECLSAFAGFPLQVTDSVDVEGYGTHVMGGVAWGGHTCPGPGPRAAQRAAIVELAREIRNPPAPAPGAPYRHVADGTLSLGEIAAARATTASHLLAVSAKAYTAADEAAVAALKMPAGTPYYTSNLG